MAGSYNHVVDDAGNLLDPERFAGMIENLGDAYEAVEEMYGMIWFLATGCRLNVKDLVEEARERYKEGLAIARDVNASVTGTTCLHRRQVDRAGLCEDCRRDYDERELDDRDRDTPPRP